MLWLSMLCIVCKENPAKVHLTQMIEGKIKKVDLCESCAKEKGVDDPTGFSLADLLLNLGASQAAVQPAPSQDVKCQTCGLTQADFKKTGRLGCADCYQYFGEVLEGLLRGMHKGTRHTGKSPRTSVNQVREAQEKVKLLQRRLEAAVAGEQFEDAAKLRDEIRALKETMTGALTT